MRLTSLLFGLFVICSLFCYWNIKQSYRKYVILVSNVLFYISYGWSYVIVFFALICISYCGGIAIARNRTKLRLIFVLTILLMPLFFIKYCSFSISMKFIAPLGISYYTFQAISYVVDVYKQKKIVEKVFVDYAVYLSFFPTVTSGPIQRSKDFLEQFRSVSGFNEDMFMQGCQRVLLGCFKKCVIADRISAIISPVLKDVYSYDGFSLILVMFGYTIMLYCDFSGYSDMAIGIAKMYGIKVKENFICPYFAVSINDFWDRWHVSLSTWLRDYIYIPLGGSKKGRLRTYLNLFITFIISGIWHGVGIKFLVWGGMHGFVRCFERFTGIDKHKKIEEWSTFSIKNKILYFIRNVVLFMLIAFTWVPFALPTTRGFLYFLSHAINFDTSFSLFFVEGFNSLVFNTYSLAIILIGIIVLYIYEIMLIRSKYDYPRLLNNKWFAIALLLAVLCFNYAGESTFIYGAF